MFLINTTSNWLVMDKNLRLFYVDGKKENLENIARTLLKDGSAICVNLMKSDGLYMYDGKMIEESGYVGIFKIVIKSAQHCKEVFDKIGELHEDEVPVILELPPVAYINDKARNYYNKEGYNITTP